MAVMIRRMKDGEIERVAEICRDEIYDDLPFEWVLDWMKSYRQPYLQLFVAEEKNKLLGFVAWGLYDRYGTELMWEISFIAVEGDHKRKGIGRRLTCESLEILRADLRTEGLELTMMMVETEEENRVACEFYDAILGSCQKVFVPNAWKKIEVGGKYFYFKSLAAPQENSRSK